MRTAVTACIIIIGAGQLCAQTSLDDRVAAKYPKVLSDFVAKIDEKEEPQHTFVRATFAGKDYVVAAYSSGPPIGVAAVELLEPAGNDVIMRQLVRDQQLGHDPDLELIDVDGDHQPEVMLTLTMGPRGGVEWWVYRCENGQLRAINPVDKHGVSLLANAEFLDLDGRGKVDIVDRINKGNRDEPVWRLEHYVLENGKYVKRAEPLDYMETFARHSGAPITETNTFSIPSNALGKPYRLTIINGESTSDAWRASAGTVTLNGVKIAVPSDFKQSRGTWVLPVSLQTENTITVRLEGEPNTGITIAIRHD
jgi:hypothetical protein